jgi:hypothetical protein
MPERAWWAVSVHKNDVEEIEKLIPHINYSDDSFPGNIAMLDVDEAYYGGAAENDCLISAGIVFFGFHDRSDHQPAHLFANDGDAFIWVLEGPNGFPVVEVVDGAVNEKQLKKVRKYEQVKANVQRMIEGRKLIDPKFLVGRVA